MYFITVFEKVEPSDMLFAEFGDQRTWGYYTEYEYAVTALHKNLTDLHECCYEYAVVEKEAKLDGKQMIMFLTAKK